MLKSFFQKKFQNTMFKTVGILLTGNAIAQVINFCLIPVVAKIYDPKDFGVFAIYWQLVSIFGAVACGKFDSALILPRDESEARNIFTVSLLMLSATSSFVLIMTLLFEKPIGHVLRLNGNLSWLKLVSMGVFASGLFQLLSCWAIRHKAFKRISTAQITQSLSNNIFKIILGIVRQGVLSGLIWAKIAGDICSSFIFFKTINFKEIKSSKPNIHELKKCFVKYNRFPILSAPAKFLNLLVVAIPSFLLMKFYSETVVGNYFMAYNLIIIPISMMGGALGNSIANDLAHLRSDPSLFRDKIRTVHNKALMWTIVPVALVWLFVGYPVQYFFDSKWMSSVSYIRILLPSMFVLFLNSPFFQVVDVLGKQGFFLTYNIALIIIRGGAIWAGAYYWNDPLISMILFSAVSVVSGLYYYYKILKFSSEGAAY